MSLLAALGVAFGYSWLTALVILGFMPVVVFASVFHYSVSNSNLGSSQEARAESAQVRCLRFTAFRKVGLGLIL